MNSVLQSVSKIQIDRLFVHPEALDTVICQRVAAALPDLPIEMAEQTPLGPERDRLSADEYVRSKRSLWLTPFRGTFFKRCPGATQKKVLNCCNYHVLNLGSQCNFDCSYCYLQSYLQHKTLKIYTNVDSALAELREMAQEHGHLPFRVGTGEIMDSLSLDPLTLVSRDLIAFFANYPKWTLEFKTKSDFVDQFLDAPHAGNVVVSWSVNPAEIVNREEHGTARLAERLAAARRCRNRGFQIAFHLDPMIYFPDWQLHYAELVDQITSQFSPDDVNVISMGALRFQPEQRFLMKERFGLKSLVTSAEMWPSEGGKLRYDFQIRNQMFDFVIQRFRGHNSRWRIFLCMETPETWIQSLQQTPMQVEGLRDLFRPLPKLALETEVATQVTNGVQS